MIGKKLDDIKKGDLDSLVENRVEEGKTIEYKAYLNIKKDSEKKEFLADVSQFANASGGDLIFGVLEEKSVATEVKGIDLDDIDEVVLKIENMIRDGIEPRLPSVNIKTVSIDDKKTVIIIRVRESWISPHRVVFGGHDKFYTRTSKGKHSMDVSELRVAFNLSDTIIEKVRKFKDGRILKIIADETPVLLYDSPKMVLHLIPLISFNPGQRYDIVALNDSGQPLPLICWNGNKRRYNLDGLLNFVDGGIRGSNSYTQFFRYGIIEGVDTYVFNKDRSLIDQGFEINIIKFLTNCLKILNEMNIEPPFVVFLTLVGVNGYEISYQPPYDRPIHNIRLKKRKERDPFKIDRDVLIIPEVMLEGFDENLPKVLKPIFDSVWNACNFPYSYNYDDNGEIQRKGAK